MNIAGNAYRERVPLPSNPRALGTGAGLNSARSTSRFDNARVDERRGCNNDEARKRAGTFCLNAAGGFHLYDEEWDESKIHGDYMERRIRRNDEAPCSLSFFSSLWLRAGPARRVAEYRHIWDQIRRSFCPADRLPEFQGEPKLEPIKMPGIPRLLRLIRRSVRGPQHAPPPPSSSFSSFRTFLPSSPSPPTPCSPCSSSVWTLPSSSSSSFSFLSPLPPPLPSLSFPEAHQRLTKYLTRSSPSPLPSLGRGGGPARRFKRYCFIPQTRQTGKVRGGVGWKLFCINSELSQRDRAPLLVLLLFFFFFSSFSPSPIARSVPSVYRAGSSGWE